MGSAVTALSQAIPQLLATGALPLGEFHSGQKEDTATPFYSSPPCARLQIENVFIDYIPIVGRHTQVEAVVVFPSNLEKNVENSNGFKNN